VQAKQETGPISIKVVPVTLKQLQRDVESVGTLFPYEEVTISSEIDGRVSKSAPTLVTVSRRTRRWCRFRRRAAHLLAQNEAQLRQSLERLGLKDEKDKGRGHQIHAGRTPRAGGPD